MILDSSDSYDRILLLLAEANNELKGRWKLQNMPWSNTFRAESGGYIVILFGYSWFEARTPRHLYSRNNESLPGSYETLHDGYSRESRLG